MGGANSTVKISQDINNIKVKLNEYLNPLFDKNGKWAPNYGDSYMKDLLMLMDTEICKKTNIILTNELKKLPTHQIEMEGNIINGYIINNFENDDITYHKYDKLIKKKKQDI